MVKRRETHGLHVLVVAVGTEIMPEAQGERGQFQPAVAAAVVRHRGIPVITSGIRHAKSSYLFY